MNTKKIYKCKNCSTVIELLKGEGRNLVCCGEEMELLTAKVEDKGTEKHLPVIEELPAAVCNEKDGYLVKVGEVTHPMEEDHYIEWIEINTADGKKGKKFLKPTDKPEAVFQTREKIESIRVYCNIHGLWILKLN
jgi:superoxide reductase